MNILIAPNAFKNSLDAEAAAIAIKEGLIQSKLKCNCECFPIGDGGDGTGKLIIEKFGGTNIVAEVHDPLGRTIKTTFGLIENGKTAVIEMAKASGLQLLSAHELDPLNANSFGTGELILKALDHGARKIILGMGGSATVDGSCGILNALGVRFLNAKGETLPATPASMVNLTNIDLSGIDHRIADCEIIILCDVKNKLLGAKGAAAVFGPQKGASADDVSTLELALSKLAFVGFQITGKNISDMQHAGTAGGAAAGLYLFSNAQLKNGIDYFLEFTGFDSSLQNAHLVITGEGSIDEQTLEGKGPFGVALRAKNLQIPVIGICGKVPLEESENLRTYFDALFSINHEAIILEDAIALTKENLVRTSRQLGNLLSIYNSY